MNETLKRLAILYTFSKAGLKLSKDQIALILLNTTSLTWFDLQLTLNKLIEDQLITLDKTQKMAPTINGDQVVKVYAGDIPQDIRDRIDTYINENSESLKTELLTYSHFSHHNEGYKVDLKIIENNLNLLEVSLFIPTREQAERICEAFQKNPNGIYKSILEILS